jgi:hypothetical protein
MKVQHMKLRSGINKPEDIKVKYDTSLTDRQLYEREMNVSKADGKQYQKFYVTAEQYNTNDKVFSNCNSMLFLNTGTVAVTVLSIVLQPLQQIEIQGNRGEIDTTQYIITFPTPNAAGNQLTVIRKFYV